MDEIQNKYLLLYFSYTQLTPLSSDIVSLLGSIAEQMLYFTKTEPYTGNHVSYIVCRIPLHSL